MGDVCYLLAYCFGKGHETSADEVSDVEKSKKWTVRMLLFGQLKGHGPTVYLDFTPDINSPVFGLQSYIQAPITPFIVEIIQLDRRTNACAPLNHNRTRVCHLTNNM